MVQTRGQRRREAIWEELENQPLPSYDESQCEECSQRQEFNDNSSFYSTGDQCKRHRRRDREPYTEPVSGYRRRVAKK